MNVCSSYKIQDFEQKTPSFYWKSKALSQVKKGPFKVGKIYSNQGQKCPQPQPQPQV